MPRKPVVPGPVKPLPIERKECYVYIGRRWTTKDKVAYFWYELGKDPETAQGWHQQIAPAAIGEVWELTYSQGSTYYIRGDLRPQRVRFEEGDTTPTLQQLHEWEGEDQAAHQRQFDKQADAALARRKSEFDKAIEPLRQMVAAVPFHDAREALIARIATRLRRPGPY